MILIAPFNDLQAAEMLVDEFKDIAPSNPLVRIITNYVPGFKRVLQNTNVPIIAVSPLINDEKS